MFQYLKIYSPDLFSGGSKCFQFHAIFWKKNQNCMLAPSGGFVPPSTGNPDLSHVLWFSDFVFKIRLIRQVFVSKKQKLLYLNPQPIDSQSGVLTITPQRQLSVGDTEKLSVTFSYAWLILVELTTYWFLVRSHNHYTTEPTVSGRHRKTFSNLQSCLTNSSRILLILLIQLIQYKIGKTR